MQQTRKLFLLALASGLPWMIATLVLLLVGGFSNIVWITVLILASWTWFLILYVLHDDIVRPFQVISSLLAGLREGDPSAKARVREPDDPAGQVMVEINALSNSLQSQRVGAVEAQHLLYKLLDRIDVAVLALSESSRLTMANTAAADLFLQPSEKLLGKPADDLGLGAAIRAESGSVARLNFPARSGRWIVKHSAFREGGAPHRLLLLADVSRPMREEELAAWKRLIRVLGHELNNSMTPIKSLAGSLRKRLDDQKMPADTRERLSEGLDVIAKRVENLSLFVEDYSRIAKLPAPQKAPVNIREIIHRVASVQPNASVTIDEGPECSISADAAQVEQVLINLLKNSVEAAGETNGEVRVGWALTENHLEITFIDTGSGIENPDNLFTPFYTTKPQGTGIGLTLSRQIAEEHDGTLDLRNRDGSPGAIATLTLPI